MSLDYQNPTYVSLMTNRARNSLPAKARATCGSTTNVYLLLPLNTHFFSLPTPAYLKFFLPQMWLYTINHVHSTRCCEIFLRPLKKSMTFLCTSRWAKHKTLTALSWLLQDTTNTVLQMELIKKKRYCYKTYRSWNRSEKLKGVENCTNRFIWGNGLFF